MESPWMDGIAFAKYLENYISTHSARATQPAQPVRPVRPLRLAPAPKVEIQSVPKPKARLYGRNERVKTRCPNKATAKYAKPRRPRIVPKGFVNDLGHLPDDF